LPLVPKSDGMLPAGDLIVTGILFTAAAYLMGSLPFSVWIGKGFFHTDVREHGSGNAGATNTWRVLGWKAGLPVLLLDIGKGLAATFLPFIYSSITSSPDLLLWERVLCGTAAAAGHIYPVFAGFRGGKAVATLFGVLIGLMPVPAALSLAVFLVVFLAFRFVSLGSILAGLSLPVLVYFLTGRPVQLISFSLLISILVLATHRQNIKRLIRGEESKLAFRRGEKKKPG
jgi:glycerol-3-phosphate acyltransferase PlsY